LVARLNDRCSNVSAEIFVVCREYLAPKHIDPKFLDPRHVFKDLSASADTSGPDKGTSSGNVQMNVFQPEKRRRKRDGYADGDYTLHRKVPVSEFVKASDPIAVLGTANQMTFDTDEEKGWARLAACSALVYAVLTRSTAGWHSISLPLMSKPTATT
jgi:AdoMet-dependent rRNA methyltransferase SPB1